MTNAEAIEALKSGKKVTIAEKPDGYFQLFHHDVVIWCKPVTACAASMGMRCTLEQFDGLDFDFREYEQ